MDRVRFIAAWLASLVYWVVGGTLFWVLCVILLVGVRDRRRSARIGQLALKCAFRGFIRLLVAFRAVECTYAGFAELRAQTGRLIIAPNHPALWDAVFVLAEVEPSACVLKASLMANPVLRGGVNAAGFIPNKPVHRMLRRCVEVLRDDERLLFFPEGTRTRREENCVNDFNLGLAVIARQSEAPVWPIFVETDSAYLRKGWPLWRLPPRKVHLRLTVGTPVTYASYGNAQSFMTALRNQYIDFLQGTA